MEFDEKNILLVFKNHVLLPSKLNIKRTNIQICFNMARKIEVSPEVRKQLSAEFGISETSVYKALGYVTDSELANKVRERAIEKGGREWYSKDD